MYSCFYLMLILYFLHISTDVIIDFDFDLRINNNKCTHAYELIPMFKLWGNYCPCHNILELDSFKETIGFDIKALFASRLVSGLIS